jgi:methionyl-tRNA formyltransferase
MGADLLGETLGGYETLEPVPQNELESSVAPIMRKEDGLISWMLSARQINARVRGFQPFPTAFSYYREKKLTVWKAMPVDNVDGNQGTPTPGEILYASGEDLRVFCGGDSVLRIVELQVEGKRRVGARDFINGVRPRVGDILGS